MGGNVPLSDSASDSSSVTVQELNSQPSDALPSPVSESDAVIEGGTTPSSEMAVEAPFISGHRWSPLLSSVSQTKVSRWLWLGLVLSLGLHIGLLTAPIEHTPPPSPSQAKAPEKQVRITQLNKLKLPKSPKKLARPTIKAVVRRPTVPPIPQLKPAPPLQREPVPQSKQALQGPTTLESEPAAAESSSWDDFPLYPSAQPGCFGLPSCLQTADSLKQVADYYVKELPAKKYELKPTVQDGTRQVFQVSRKGETQFLSIIQTGTGQAIVLSDAPRSLDDLQKAVEVPPEVAAILSSLAAENANVSDFVQPDFVYTRSTAKGYASGASIPKPDVVNISLVRSYSFDTMMNEFFRGNLVAAGFDVTDLPQTTGGGKLYKVSKESTTFFLSLLPTKGGDSTLIVTWKTLPK